MKFRFVYVNGEGGQVEIDSVESLRRAVEAGELHEGTLLYDGLTRDWAPARVHPIYRLIRDTLREGAETGGGELLERTLILPEDASDTAVPEAPGELEFDPEMDLDLGPVAVPGLNIGAHDADRDADHESRFWEEQAREAEKARMEGHVEPAFAASDVTFDDRGTELLRDASVESEEEGRPAAGRDRTPAVVHPDPAPDADLLLPLDIPGWDEERPFRENLGVAMQMEVPRRQAALMVLLAGIGGWAIADSWAPPVPEVDGPEMVHVASMYRVSRYFTRGHADVRTAAFSDMIRGMDALRAQLSIDAPPEAWLTPEYLNSPANHPEVAVYWGRYGSFVEQLREREEALFRSGYVSRLQRKGITGSVLSIQVARALTEFKDDRPRREVLYQAMEELSVASLALHGALLEDEEARGEGSLDAAPSSRRELELQRVLRAVDTVSGGEPGEGDGWLGEGALESLRRLDDRGSASE